MSRGSGASPNCDAVTLNTLVVRIPLFLKWATLVPTVVAVTLSHGIGIGQNLPSSPPEPQLVAVFFYLDPASPELKPLPSESWTTQGFFGGSSIEVSGTGSPFRVANGSPEFIVQVTHPEYAKLFQFTVNLKSKKRRFLLTKANHRTRDSDPGISTTITKFGNSSFKLAPKQPLGAGEYALFVGEVALHVGSRLFTFAVGEP